MKCPVCGSYNTDQIGRAEWECLDCNSIIFDNDEDDEE